MRYKIICKKTFPNHKKICRMSLYHEMRIKIRKNFEEKLSKCSLTEGKINVFVLFSLKFA